ncbi:MAG TPA: hypothetical protein VGI73_00635 [Solirubrobacterales bacterium]
MPLSLAAAAVTAYAVGDAILAPRPAPASPGFVDTLLASRAVVAAIRVAIIAASCFVAASVVALARRGRWLTRVGPVEVADVSDTYEENRQLKELLDIADNTIQDLRRHDGSD